jgi:hypothetical protein
MGRAAEFGPGHAQVPARIGMEGLILTSGRRSAGRSGSHKIAGTSSPALVTVNGVFRTLGSRAGSGVTLQYPVSVPCW